jgi:hypothetical protein
MRPSVFLREDIMRRPSLDSVANVAIIIASVVTVGVLVSRQLTDSTSAPGVPGTELFQKGRAAPALEGVTYASKPLTLVMYVRSTCGFCTESMPFYRSLAERRVDRSALQLVAVSPEPASVSQSYLQTHSVSVDSIVSSNAQAVPTPTLLLVDQFGKIRDVWIGKQDSAGERVIGQALGVRLDVALVMP